MLKRQTTHDLVVTIVPGDIVTQVPDGVVNGVVPGKQLITQSHVVVLAAILVGHGDVDEGELARVGGTDVVQLGEGGQELIREVVSQAAVQVSREGVYQVVHAVHRVGEGEGVHRHAVVGHARTTVHRGTVGVAPVAVLGVVVTQRQVVVGVDVPVQAGQQLVVVLIGRETGIGTRVITVLVHHVILHAFQVVNRGTRDKLICVAHAILRSAPAVHDGGLLGHFTVDKEEELVLPDRATQGEAVGSHLILFTGSSKLNAVNSVTAHVLVAVEDVGTAAEGVGTTLGNGVNTTADEVGLANVVGRDHHLHLLDSLDRDGVTTTRQVVTQTEVVVEVCTIDREVSQTTVGTSKAHAITTEGRQTGNVGQAAGNGRQVGNLGAVDVGCSTGLLGTELRGLGGYNHLTQGVGVNTHVNIQVIGLGQLKGYILNFAGLITDVAHRHGVGATGTHTLDRVAAVHVGHGVVLSARGRVQGSNRSTDHRLLIFIGHNTGQCRGRHLSIYRQCHEEHRHQC